MKDMVNWFIRTVALCHERILSLNDTWETYLSDKELHFLVFGLAGALLFAVSWMVFLALRRHVGCAAWLFSLAVVVGIALAVEVGQEISGTGAMDLYDIAWGVAGYVALSAVLGVGLVIARGFRNRRRR